MVYKTLVLNTLISVALFVASGPASGQDYSIPTPLNPADITEGVDVSDNPDRYQDDWIRPNASINDTFSDDDPLVIEFPFTAPRWLRLTDLDDSSNDNGTGFTSEAMHFLFDWAGSIDQDDEVGLDWEILDQNLDPIASGNSVYVASSDGVTGVWGVFAIGAGNIVPENTSLDVYGLRGTMTARDSTGASMELTLEECSLGLRADDITIVPEPGILVLLGFAAAMIFMRRRRT